SAHRAVEQSVQRLLHLVRGDPGVERAGVLLVDGADVGAIFDAGDVLGVGGRVVGVLGSVHAPKGPALAERPSDPVLLRAATIDRDNLFRGGEGCDPADQRQHRFVVGRGLLQLISDDIMVEDSHEWSPLGSRVRGFRLGRWLIPSSGWYTSTVGWGQPRKSPVSVT